MTRTIIENAHIATVDAASTEYPTGHVVVDGGRISAVGAGRAPDPLREGAEIVDARGCLVTPGLINTHHHLYQWLTRGYAQDSILFDWLTALYPLWARIDAGLTGAGAAGGMAVLARSGCTTVGDHHYVFPRGSGDIVGALVESASTVGVRLHATRGSMDLGQSQGGLPPDFAVETTDAALKASQEAVERYHDPSFDAMVHIAIAPCSPFSVTADLLREAAVLARSLDVRLHTHASETVEEDAYCAEHFGKSLPASIHLLTFGIFRGQMNLEPLVEVLAECSVDVLSGREQAPAPQVVQAADEFHVLLRHRLLLKPGGFEGFVPGHKEAHLTDHAVGERGEHGTDGLTDRDTRSLDPSLVRDQGDDRVGDVDQLLRFPLNFVEGVGPFTPQFGKALPPVIDRVRGPLGEGMPDPLRGKKADNSLGARVVPAFDHPAR